MRIASPFAVMVALLVPCPCLMAADEVKVDAPATYFESTGVLPSPPTRFLVRVPSVKHGLPADRAGLRAGDGIIGLDGLRVRNVREYHLVRYYYDQRPSLSLTVVRGGETVNVAIPDPAPVRYGGFELADETPNFLSALKSAGMLADDLLPVPLPGVRPAGTNDAIDAFVQAFDATDDPSIELGSDLAVALASFPARAQEEIIALLAVNAPGDREWIAGLLKVYGRLLVERHDEAIRIMDEARLLDRSPAPFLGRLLRFYRTIAERPLAPGDGIAVDAYHVDIPFFALCYPYPVSTNAHFCAFQADPRYEDLLAKAFSGSRTRDRFSDELTAAANQYAASKGSNAVEGYIAVVKAATLDAERHGGWPYRCDTIWSAKQSAAMIVELKQRLETNAAERTEIALSLVGPSMIAGDEAAFRQACDMANEAGPVASALARWIMRSAISMRGNLPPGRWQAIAAESEAAAPKARIYTSLQRASPAFSRRCAAGQWMVNARRRGDVAGLSSSCFAYPFMVAGALEQPIDADRSMEEALAAVGTADSNELDRIAARLTLVLAGDPGPNRMSVFSKLHRWLGAGRAFDVIRHAVPYHEQLWQDGGIQDGISVKDLYRDFFSDVEGRHYREAVAALDKLDSEDPGLPGKIADLYARAGVPSVCLLLSKKLKEAGRDELAAGYLQRAVDFWDAVIRAFPGQIDACTWACRDLVSTSGYEDLFDAYARPVERVSGGGLPRAILHVYRAVMDSYCGNYDSAVDHVLRSNDPVLNSSQVVSLYKGTNYRSMLILRTQWLTDLLREQRLSEAQIGRLREVSALNVDGILASLTK